MSLDRFVSGRGDIALAEDGWTMPQHVLDAIAKRSQRSAARRAFCPGASPPDNSCSPANKGDARYDALPKSFPAGTKPFRTAIDSIVADPGAIWDRSQGLAETPPPEAVASIADEQTGQAGKPLTPEAEAAYGSLVDEIGKQYESLLASGLKVRAWRGEGEPYGDPPGSTKPNSDRMRQGVADSGEFSFFMTERGFGTGDATPDHPMLRATKYQTSDGEPMIANDLFRVVHDMVAHVRGGYSFSTRGEFNGMLTHASTMPESAWPALFAEAFGQNAVYDRTKAYAQQNAYASKIGPDIIRAELSKVRPSRRADEGEDSDEPLGYQHIKSRPWLLATLERRAFCPGASPPDNSCSPANKGTGDGKCPDPCGEFDVRADGNGDGVTDAARVGVPAFDVPPPPGVPRLPNLDEKSRAAEDAFITHFEDNPDGVASQFRDLAVKQGPPPTFGTDDAKALTDAWSEADAEKRAENRATLNTALHQCANAIAKRAFIQHLDTLQPGDSIMVTVGGCGAGKGFALKNVPDALELKDQSAAIWDSAGDQNATENPWIQSEAESRGLNVTYVYVHADPRTQWADPNRGVVKRASDPKDGRMVDARVFADSYAIGANNHHAFHQANLDNPSARFVFLDNTAKPRAISGVPREALNLDSADLTSFAERTVRAAAVPDRVKRGALAGGRIWTGSASRERSARAEDQPSKTGGDAGSASEQNSDELSAWWDEDAERLNKLAEDAKGIAAKVESRAFCPGASPPDNSCSPSNKGDGPGPGRVLSTKYGMDYSPKNEKVVEKAREVPDEKWDTLPVATIPYGTKLKANEETLKTAPIEKVVSGREPFREGYVAKLWKDENGDLHIADGHHRVAMYHALKKDMPARIMSEKDYQRLMGKSSRAFCPGSSPPDNSCSPANKGSGGSSPGVDAKGGAEGGKSGRKPKKAISADVSVPSLQKHADKLAGGSRIDPKLTSKEFPAGAVVPNDPEKLAAHHAGVKRELADRINAPSDKSAKQANSAKTVDELLADAREVAPDFRDLANRVAEASGSEISFGEAGPKDEYLQKYAGGTHMLKLPESLGPKVGRVRAEDGLGPEVSDSDIVRTRLKDAVRGTLISDTPESLGDAVRSVQEQAKAAGYSVTLKNRFEDDDPSGYAAVHMTLQMKTKSGREVMTELQFHMRQAYDGNQGSPKDNSHGLYKPAPGSSTAADESKAAQLLIWSRALADVPPPPGGRKGRRRPASDAPSGRAFCPGASPPDNSCSPSNKGTGGNVSNAGRRVAVGTASKAALENLRQTGGFSVHPITGESPTTGYMVSVKPKSERVFDSYEQVNEESFRSFFEENAEAFRDNPELHFGGWIDRNTGKVYFDLSVRHEKIEDAIDDAQKTNQLAIWNLTAREEIRQEDYAKRRAAGRSQAVRKVRLPAGPNASRNGKGVSRVRQEHDVGQAGQPKRIVGFAAGVKRAFCPGASPPDNSCSPANKGAAGPMPPEPAWDDSTVLGNLDSRGALTGHNRQQRQKYADDATKWLADRGVQLTIRDDIDGPPTIGAVQVAVRGVEGLERIGAEVPTEITIENLMGNAPAAFGFESKEFVIDPDLDLVRISGEIDRGTLVGDPANPADTILIHEAAHRDHGESVRAEVEAGGDDKAAYISKIRSLLGLHMSTPTPENDPWAAGIRMRSTATAGGKPLGAAEAKQLAASVSRYAATNPMEFVAEVRTGLATGRTYQKPVMDLYADYLGPPAKPPRARKAA